MSNYPRARFGMAVAVAFICGLVFASGFDLTRFGWAQTRMASGPSVPATAVAPLAETQTAFETIVDKVKPAIVSIHVAKYAQPVSNQRPGQGQSQGQGRGRQQRQGQQGQGQGQGGQQLPPGMEDFFRQFGGDVPDQSDTPKEGSGSGFIVSSDGYILTNNHVVAGVDSVRVILVDKRSYSAKVIGADPTTDVAVIKINATNLPTVPLGDDATARVGQWVLAFGNPLDLDFTVTAGIISAKGRNITGLPRQSNYSISDFIQTDAAINPGNSGGPLVNIRGEVIGINSAIASGTGFYAGYGFAIPIGLVKTVMKDLMTDGKVHRAVVGVSLKEVSPEDAQAAGLKEIRGAMVSDFTTESAAKKAGVQLGDVILAADGKPIDQVPTLQRIIRTYGVGQTVKLDIMRFGQPKQITVKLTEVIPDAQPAVVASTGNDSADNAASERVTTKEFSKLGLSASALPASIAKDANVPAAERKGVLITKVSQESDARLKGLDRYDVIEEVIYPSRHEIKSLGDLEQVVSGLKSGDVITLRLYRLTVGSHVLTLRVQ